MSFRTAINDASYQLIKIERLLDRIADLKCFYGRDSHDPALHSDLADYMASLNAIVDSLPESQIDAAWRLIDAVL